ncbi:PP2C family protein-serine/threonine phosphatase [Streptomyces sp. NPDC015131]|uniref:PP2C family protein-serine/threonine phosphatase n=1 Tax=Streptomyces sp. NPDC015131 TaxID=3364941 RepID=UPI0036F4D92E
MSRSGGDERGGAASGPAGARLVLLEQAVESIGTALDERGTCEELVRFLCRDLCDAAMVDVTATAGVAGEPGEALRVAADPDGLLGRLSPGAAPSGAAPSGAAPSVEAHDEGQPIVLSGGPPYAVSVPLVHGRRLYGSALALRARRPFTDSDTAVVHFAARLAAVHVRHAREHARVRDTAVSLQRALLTEPGQPHPNLDLATHYLPSGGGALVGGDWYETVRLHYGRTLLVMGDVMGHGLDAAVDMNAYRSMLRYIASTDLPPHRVLRQLDAAVAGDGVRRPATCLLGRVDPARGVVAFASAGHLPPVVFSADGTGELVPVPVGPPLGTGFGGYEMSARALTPDETLLMFTDGLVERRGEDIDASLARLTGLRPSPGGTVGELIGEVLDRLDARHAEDDVAVLAARTRHRPGDHLAGPPL